MDFRAEVLLRNYIATGDPEDAVEFADEMARSGKPDNTIWISQTRSLREDEPDDVTLHLSKKAAYQSAIAFVLDMLRDTYSTYAPPWVVDIYDLVTQADRVSLDEALAIFEDVLRVYNEYYTDALSRKITIWVYALGYRGKRSWR